VRAEPPSAPAENAIDNDVSPGVIEIPVGALDVVADVTAADAVDAVDVPVELVAVAMNLYSVPLVRPVTTQLPDDPVTVHVFVASLTALTTNEAGVPPIPAATVTVT
jgi:sulfur carrier protein ThiS